MKLKLLKFYDAVIESFWFLPAMMAILSAGFALGSVALDHNIGSQWVQGNAWIWSGGADGARSVLSVIAGSVMTVVSIVFSITVTALAQTSSHYGPRVLRNFTSDRSNQFVLGTFIATFIYCLLVLRTVRSYNEISFIPYLSVNVGIGLSLASLAVLIFFIHHVSQSIQAGHLIGGVGEDFQKILPVLFPERIGEEAEDCEMPPEEQWEKSSEVTAPCNGYIQRVDENQIMKIAIKHDLILRLDCRPGDFVITDGGLLRALPPARLTKQAENQLRDCFSIGRHRTPHQDAIYTMQQLVEIASLALSPGVNEPFTATTAIDWIGASLHGVAVRPIPSAQRCDEQGKLRIIARPTAFSDLVHTAFDPIRLYGAQTPDIALRLLQVIEELAPHLHREGDFIALENQAHLIGDDASQIFNASDRQRVQSALVKTLRALERDQ